MIEPHDVAGEDTLAPSRARPPSATMATPTPSSPITSIEGSTLGRISRHMIRNGLAPIALAAVTNSRSATASVEARAIRPSTGIDTTPSAPASTKMRRVGLTRSGSAGSNAATSASAKMMAGMARNVSKKIDNTVSTLPRRYPAKMPIVPPITMPTDTATNPTSSETRPP